MALFSIEEPLPRDPTGKKELEKQIETHFLTGGDRDVVAREESGWELFRLQLLQKNEIELRLEKLVSFFLRRTIA